MTWRELSTLVRGLPGDGTALWRESRRNMPKNAKGVKVSAPPAEFWTADRDLLATVADELAVLIWMKTKDGSKGRNYPKPIARPGVSNPGESRMGTPMSVAELEARFLAARVADDERQHPEAEPEGPEDPEGDSPSGES
jgi:hypothetical protein